MTEGADDQYPDMTLAAEGNGPGGERWSLRTWGTRAEFFRLVRIDYPDGSRDGAATSGPVPPAYGLWESSERQVRGGILLTVWADPQVRRLRVRSKSGEQYDLEPVKDDQSVGVTLFVGLFHWPARSASVQALDSAGLPFSEDEVGH